MHSLLDAQPSTMSILWLITSIVPAANRALLSLRASSSHLSSSREKKTRTLKLSLFWFLSGEVSRFRILRRVHYSFVFAFLHSCICSFFRSFVLPLCLLLMRRTSLVCDVNTKRARVGEQRGHVHVSSRVRTWR